MKISVLIPCYNGEQFIDKCIESVLKQTYVVDEILIINDGSTDNSLQKIESWITKNKLIKVVTQENLGLGITRNDLISKSTGDFFLFLDCDDWLENYCIQNFVDKLKENDYDTIFSSSFKNNKIFKFNSKINDKTTKETYAIYNATYVWNIFISRKFWTQNKLYFNDKSKLFEDIGLFTHIISRSKKTGFISTPGYHYNVDIKLHKRKIPKESIDDCFIQIQYLYNLLNNDYNKKYPRYINDNLAFSLSILLNFIVFLSNDLPKIKYIKKLRQLEKDNGKIKFPKSFAKFWFFFLYRLFVW